MMKRVLRFASLFLACAVVCDAQTPDDKLPAVTRHALLRDIADRVLVPGYLELAIAGRQLQGAVSNLCVQPSREAIGHAQQSWRAATRLLSRLACYRSGPMALYADSFYYWNILPKRIEAIIASTGPLVSLRDQASTVKGFFALEYLLFEPDRGAAKGQAANVWERLAGSERRRQYLQALVAEVVSKMDQLASDWSDPGAAGARGAFVSGGQETINLLVNGLSQTMEEVHDRHLSFVLVLPEPVSGQLDRIRGSRSGSSLELVIDRLEGARLLYQGAEGLGLDDELRRTNPLAEERLREKFETALLALRELGMPLEDAVVRNRAELQAASDLSHALEIVFKVDVASALGVTLTFEPIDGD